MSRREDTQRRKVAKRLQEEISKCIDPLVLVKLTKQYNELKPKKAASNPEPTIVHPGKLPRRKTGSAVDELSDENYRRHLVVVSAEAIRGKLNISEKEATRQAISELAAGGLINAEDFLEKSVIED